MKPDKEEMEKLREVEDRWISHFEKIEFDEEKAREFVRIIYESGGLQEPEIIICNGPTTVKEGFRNHISSNDILSGYSSISDEILEEKPSDIRVFSSVFVFSQLFSLGKDVYSKLTREEVFFYSHYLKTTLDKLKHYLGKDMQDVLKDIIICDYFNEIGLIKDKKTINYLLKIKELIKCNIYSMVCLREACFISKPPIIVKLDNNKELHSAEGPAIYFEDKTSYYYVYGIPFSEGEYHQYVKGDATGRKILSARNVEQKAVLIKLFGYERILTDLDHSRIIDKYEKTSQITGKKTTCQLFEFMIDSATLRVLKVEDHSVHKLTFLGVPRTNQTKTCIGAIAWTFGLKTEDYQPMMES